MKQSYSTKELAKMWDVSESTIKRWADAGMLKCRKTVGGHRKFEHEAIDEFQNHCPLAKKELDAAAENAGGGELKRLLDETDFDGLAELYKQAALAGESRHVACLLSQSTRHGLSLATIGEEIIKPAMHEIGRLWRTGKIGVLDERLATFSTIEALTDLQSSIAKKDNQDRRAIVGCSEGELHELASILVRNALDSDGWNVVYLGAHTPLFSFAEAINRFKPQVVCISITMVDNIERAARDYEALRRAAMKWKTKIILGGAALKDDARGRFRGALYAETLHDLLRELSDED
jgi:MerR family transcriptional regulator, light-induced transcriptional regulator